MLIWILIAISFLTLGLLFSLWRQRREGSQASEELVQLTSSLQLAMRDWSGNFAMPSTSLPEAVAKS